MNSCHFSWDPAPSKEKMTNCGGLLALLELDHRHVRQPAGRRPARWSARWSSASAVVWSWLRWTTRPASRCASWRGRRRPCWRSGPTRWSSREPSRSWSTVPRPTRRVVHRGRCAPVDQHADHARQHDHQAQHQIPGPHAFPVRRSSSRTSGPSGPSCDWAAATATCSPGLPRESALSVARASGQFFTPTARCVRRSCVRRQRSLTSSRLSTLPLGPSGNASANSTRRGYLCRPSRSWDQAISVGRVEVGTLGRADHHGADLLAVARRR